MSSERPNAYSIIYWLIKDKKIEDDRIFSFQELFWPTFLELDGHILLKENFNAEAFDRLTTSNENPEYWMNLFMVDDYFSESDDWEEKSTSFAKTLVEIWKIKLQNDYPHKKFLVQFLQDKETGDYGLTFYQA